MIPAGCFPGNVKPCHVLAGVRMHLLIAGFGNAADPNVCNSRPQCTRRLHIVVMQHMHIRVSHGCTQHLGRRYTEAGSCRGHVSFSADVWVHPRSVDTTAVCASLPSLAHSWMPRYHVKSLHQRMRKWHACRTDAAVINPKPCNLFMQLLHYRDLCAPGTLRPVLPTQTRTCLPGRAPCRSFACSLGCLVRGARPRNASSRPTQLLVSEVPVAAD